MARDPAEELKRDAAERALTYVRSGMVLGLGTGSTVAHFIEALGEALASGALRGIQAVPSSERTTREAEAVGVPLVDLADHPVLALTVDGTDEVTEDLDLVKGMGGALLREKMIAQASQRFVVIADERKVVPRLGTVSPLPVEVVPWGVGAQLRLLESEGAEVAVRSGPRGAPYVSDNGNLILDCRFPEGIADPYGLDDRLRRRAGVVETGLFLGMADEAIIASSEGVQVMWRES